MSQRAKTKTRANIRRRAVHSISIHKTARHFRVQICDPQGKVLAGISTLNPAIRKTLKKTGDVEAARSLAPHVAQLVEKLGIQDMPLAFDRSGVKYHGRVAAFADALRESSVKI